LGYAVVGLLVGAAVNVMLNLIASAIQQKAFSDQFSDQSVVVLVVLSLIGLIAGYWLGTAVDAPEVVLNSHEQIQDSTEGVQITRLAALWSIIHIKGKNTSIKDVISLGSNIKINTKQDE
jgi:hypothetical protein